MTETSGGCVYDGTALEGAEINLDEGQILLKGPMLFGGYRLDPALTEESLAGGWFRTADFGKFDQSGRLQVLGRVDEMIITGGEKVSPAQVEAILEQHPSIKKAAVTGLPSKAWGQEVAAAIVPTNPSENVSLAEIRAFVAERASKAMAPKQLIQVPKLPKTQNGKIKRSALRSLFDPSETE